MDVTIEQLDICATDKLVINIKEITSCIGSSYRITAKHKDQESKPYWVYVDDDGVLQAYVEVDA